MQIQGADIFAEQNIVPQQTTSFLTDLTAPEWSCQDLTGPWLARSQNERPWGAPSCHNEFSRGMRVRWGPVWASQGHSGSVKTTLSKKEYELVFFGTPFCFPNISTRYNRTEMILYSEFTVGSQFQKKKNGLEIIFSVAEIVNKQPNKEIIHFLWDNL